MNTNAHYDQLLADVYSWMSGDFMQCVDDAVELFERCGILQQKGFALDAGSGHGIHACALSRMGYDVKAIECNAKLFQELITNTRSTSVEAVHDDMVNIKSFTNLNPRVITCMGDTLPHLPSVEAVANFLQSCADTLASDGILIVSFRDYGKPLTGTQRFIPVKSDDERILTCFLEYHPESILVTDLLYLRTESGWMPKISSYSKVRVTESNITEMLIECSLTIFHRETNRGMVTLAARKGTASVA